MLKEEFERLIALFQKASEGKVVNLEEVFGQSLVFFQHMKEQIATGTEEDRKEAMRMMAEMYQQMLIASKKICEASGMTEEQLALFAENPSNFTPEQWKAIQASKEKVVDAGKDLINTLEKTVKKEESSSKGSQDLKPKGHKEKKGKKSNWLRS